MLGDIWNNVLFYPFLNLLMLMYHFLGDNLGWAVILFAVITRLVLIPMVKNQTEMMKKMSDLKPKLDKLQKKYAANQEKLAQEQMKMYKEAGYNPLGCATSFVPQILILYVIIQVIRVVSDNNFGGLYPWVENYVFSGGIEINTHFFFLDLSRNYNDIAKDLGYLAPSGIAYFVLAISVGVVQFISSKFMREMQGQNKPVKKSNKDEKLSPEEMQAEMMKSMTNIFPIMTAFIALGYPAVLGLYWFTQSLMLVIQYFIIDFDKAKKALSSVIDIKK